MEPAPPYVAVLLAAYNGIAWIEEQLASIQRQTGVRVSIFISVDSSTDGTDEWCRSYSANNLDVTVLPPAGRFGGAARNFFRLIRDVDFSCFDFVAFSDQDDIWLEHKLQRATAKLQEDGFDAYSSNVTAFWPDGRRLLLDKAQPQVRWDHLFEAAGPGCTYVLNRSLADAFKDSLISNWDEAQAVSLHDWYCYAFARSHGFRWFIDPMPGLEYRQHAGNQVGANTGVNALLARLKAITNGWWPEQVLLIDRLTAKAPILAPRSTSRPSRTFLKLVSKANLCRRRRRDKFLFIVACIAAAMRH